MERYEKIQELSSGSFGEVWKGKNRETGEVVCIKNLKGKSHSSTTEEYYLNIMRRMKHPNIVRLKEATKEEDNSLFLVLEYMESNLHQVIKHRMTLFSESEIKKWLFQVFQGLAYIHQRGRFHGNLKPKNLFVSKNIIKIANLGSAREIYSQQHCYKAPEILLKSAICDSAVDMWAMGAIMAELFTLHPLFPAGSSEVDQMDKIFSVLGNPDWEGGFVPADATHYKFPELKGVQLVVSDSFPTASKDATNLISSLCSWDPLKRPTAMECLQHPFFHGSYHVPRTLLARTSTTAAPTLLQRRPIIEKQSKETLVDEEFVPKDLKMVTEKNGVSNIIAMQKRSEPPLTDGPASISSDIIARVISENISDIQFALVGLHAQLHFANPFTGSACGSNRKPARNCPPELLRRLELNIEDAFKNEYSQLVII